MSKVYNQYGVELDFEAAVQHMDTNIREEVHQLIAPCTDQQFFDRYCALHAQHYGKIFFLDEENPVW